MTELFEPEDSAILWDAAGPDDVPINRMLMQGDIIEIKSGLISVISHPCSMRKGQNLHETQIVAPIREGQKIRWKGFYDWMPLTGSHLPGMQQPAVCLRELRSEPTSHLETGQRMSVMSDFGVCVLQQRLTHHFCRVVIDLTELEESSVPILLEAELNEEWVTDLGRDAESDFFRLLDADNRRIRGWLNEAATRPRATRAVQQEIHRRKGLM